MKKKIPFLSFPFFELLYVFYVDIYGLMQIWPNIKESYFDNENNESK